MEKFKEHYPKTGLWLESLEPFIVIRGDKHVIVKFADGRETLQLSYEKIKLFEQRKDESDFAW